MAPAAALRIVDEDATGFRSGPAARMRGDDEDAEDADEGTQTPPHPVPFTSTLTSPAHALEFITRIAATLLVSVR